MASALLQAPFVAAQGARTLAPRPAARVAAPRTLQRRSAGRRVGAAVNGRVVVASAAADKPHIQLATAKLPADVDVDFFNTQMYQWAATLTQAGRNLPFALPQRVDRLPNGFQLSLLRVGDGGAIKSVADLVATVEDVSGAGNVLMVRFFEGELSLTGAKAGASGDPQKRLQTLLGGLVDVPQIMTTMPMAIRKAAAAAR